MSATIYEGDCRFVLDMLDPGSIDSVVTDPPYNLDSIKKRFGADDAAPAKSGKTGVYARSSAGFMGQKWDNDVAFQRETWDAVFEVLKPGGHLLAFGGTRTYHRLACAIEDAGFEIRDQIGWAYGSGFPKSHNLDGEWQGWGTALKPAWEPIVVARKPLIGTVAENVQRYGTGAINVDGCRVGTGTGVPKPEYVPNFGNAVFGKGMGGGAWENSNGRWPANLIHDGSDEVLALFPESAGSGSPRTLKRSAGNRAGDWGMNAENSDEAELRDAGSGSAARFFYCAKASKADREDGCTDLPLKQGGMLSETSGQHITRRDGGAPGKVRNNHPTVKPTALMRYLCRLITPPGGTVLDPFTGSGSTGRGAVLEGFNFVGIEMQADYAAIARARIAAAEAA